MKQNRETVSYTYKILSVDTDKSSMQISFSIEGGDHQISVTRLPFVGESIEMVIEHVVANAFRMSKQTTRTVAVPDVGASGDATVTVPYSPGPQTAEQRARVERDFDLMESDWTQMPDAPLTTEQKAAWAAYRQALRNVPAQAGFPENIDWPAKPE